MRRSDNCQCLHIGSPTSGLHNKGDIKASNFKNNKRSDLTPAGIAAKSRATTRFRVELPRGDNMLTQRMPLQQRLAEITDRKTDLVPEHELNKHIRRKILNEAIEL